MASRRSLSTAAAVAVFRKQLTSSSRLSPPRFIINVLDNKSTFSGGLNHGGGWTNLWSRGVKTTSTIHPEPVHQDDEKVLEKVLQERENSEDLPETMMTNPYERPCKVCILCKHDIEPNYKNVRLLYQFVSPYTGKLYGRHITGLCKGKQTKVDAEIALAVRLGMMSNFLKEPEFLKDPKLCDPDKPFRAHRY